jgi:hypothetical protein
MLMLLQDVHKTREGKEKMLQLGLVYKIVFRTPYIVNTVQTQFCGPLANKVFVGLCRRNNATPGQNGAKLGSYR